MIFDPDQETLQNLKTRQEQQAQRRELLRSMVGQEDVTLDGRKIKLYCNIGSPEDVDAVLSNDGQGIGLFRSEFLYLATEDYPTEEEQFQAYSIVAHFAKAKTLFEDAKYHNCVFLGTDEQGVPRHAHKRSCNSVGKAFRQNIEGSDPRYSFHHIGTDGQLFVFEAPIDLLSYITMHPEDLQSHSYVACCGTSAIPVLSMLERISSPKEVYLCLDNDQAGETGSLRMAEKIAEQFNIASDRLLPEHKDWNDALCARNQEQIQAAMSMGMQV